MNLLLQKLEQFSQDDFWLQHSCTFHVVPGYVAQAMCGTRLAHL